jgi:hypothetical protein
LVLTTRTSSLAGLLVAAAVLYLARDVLIPLALAILLSFLLAPVVRRLINGGSARPRPSPRWHRFRRSPASLGGRAGTVCVPEYRENIGKIAYCARATARSEGRRSDQTARKRGGAATQRRR